MHRTSLSPASRPWPPSDLRGLIGNLDQIAAGCNVREVSEWAGHHSVAFTLTRYGGLFEDGSNEAIDRLDALLQTPQGRTSVSELRRG